MATIDASIAMSGRLPKIDSPFEAQAKAMQYREMQQRNKLAEMMFADRERESGERNALSGLYRDSIDPSGQIDRAKLMGGAAQRGLGAQIPGMQKTFADQDKVAAEADTKKFEIATKRHDYYKKALGALAQEPALTKEMVLQAGQSLVQQGILPAEMYQQSVQNLPDDINELRARLIQGVKQQMTPEQMFTVFSPKPEKVDNGQQIGYRDMNPNSPTYGQATGGAAVQKMQSPDSVASVAATIRGQDKTEERAEKTHQGTEVPFTPEAISNAASRYNIDGTLPPMGMGKTGAQARSAILNRAAELAAESGLSGDDQRILQIGNKANSAAMSKLSQQKTMVGAFERNFVMNADIVLELSEKVDRTGIPIANKWINAGKRNILGDPEISAFDAAVKAVSNEYAKIVSGSMGNTALAEGEIKKIEKLLNAAQTPAQVKSVVALMKRETENRMKGFDDELDHLRERMGGKKDAPHSSPSAPNIESLLDKYK